MKIDCHNQALTQLPSLLMYQCVVSLNCSANNLTELPWEIGSLRNLQTLNCSENSLRTLPASIDQLVSLINLDCSSNKLTFLPDAIGKLCCLHSLNCSNNQIITLPHSIENLMNLKRLKILWNYPGCLNGIQPCKLQNLTLLHADLLNIPILSPMPNLKSIVSAIDPRVDPYVSALDPNDDPISNSTSMKSLITSLMQCHILTELDISNYLIETLPVTIGTIQSLTSLRIRSNHLRELPCTIGMLRNLTELNLEQNDLRTLPRTIGFLTKLVELNIQSNLLTHLPEELYELTMLERLYVNSNHLTTMSPKMVALNSLHVFVYFNNPISLPPNVQCFVDLIGSTNQPIKNAIPQGIITYINTASRILAPLDSNNNTMPHLPLNAPNVMTPYKFSVLMQTIQADTDLWNTTKSTMTNFCNDTVVDPYLCITYQEMLACIWLLIQRHPQSQAIKHRLNIFTTMAQLMQHSKTPIVARIASLVASIDHMDVMCGRHEAYLNQFHIIRAIQVSMLQQGVKCKANKAAFYGEINKHVHQSTNAVETLLMKQYIDFLVA